eukprot:3680613-Lingulodinium_polyedra.AAC.1
MAESSGDGEPEVVSLVKRYAAPLGSCGHKDVSLMSRLLEAAKSCLKQQAEGLVREAGDRP